MSFRDMYLDERNVTQDIYLDEANVIQGYVSG